MRLHLFLGLERKPLSVFAHLAMSEPRLRSFGTDGNEQTTVTP